MRTHLAINGFGPIGRLVLRTLQERYKKNLAVITVKNEWLTVAASQPRNVHGRKRD
jgi:glyceraldehyde-3-phosphate dehydrogenase/erythrose-4-phosphate dehydrogenase